MSTRPTLHRSRGALLQKLLDEPNLDRWIAELSGPEWKALIQHIGLEDSSELLALSKPEQLVELLDETLWSGPDESLDVERFATLLEVLHEAGSRELAEKVAALPEEFLTHALSKLVSVWPTEFLQQMAEADEDGTLDKRLESQMFEEVDEYSLLSPSGLAWDPLMTLLGAWGDSQPELLSRILKRLSMASVNGIGEPDELVHVLDEMAEYEEEAQAEREERRARSGYLSQKDAQAFLRLPPTTRPRERDAISAAYFRRLSPEQARPPSLQDARLLELLRDPARAGAGSSKRRLNTGAGLLKTALRELADSSAELHAQMLEELAFLSNVMVSSLDAKSTRGEAPNSAEAIRSVVAAIEAAGIGEVGLEPPIATAKLRRALETWGPIALFRNRPR